MLDRQDGQTDLSAVESAVADARKSAEAFQNYVVSLVKLREALEQNYKASQAIAGEPEKDKPPRPALEKSQTALLEEIFGKEGLLAVAKNQTEKLLPAELKSQLGKLRDEQEKLKKSAPPKYPFVHTLKEGSKIRDLPVLARGNPDAAGDPAPRRFLRLLAGENSPVFTNGSGRLELARAIAGPDNPLTARVMVNRIWQHHFGQGLVRTPSNFGTLGEKPSHPELLDYLADQFVQSGWSIKTLHRRIMLSRAYQMSSESDARNQELDAENKFLWRMNRRRLEVEAWRDAMLAVSGNLDRTVGGPSRDLAASENRRRTFYAAVSRHELNSVLRLFDFPDPNVTSDTRTVTTVPLQQLFVLNSEFMVKQAKALASRLKSATDESEAGRIRRAFLTVYGRPPTERELRLGLEFLADFKSETERKISAAENENSQSNKDAKSLSKWEQYTQVLLSANEFLYVD